MHSGAFNAADYAIILLILGSMAIGVVRGFVRETLTLATWATAFWVAFSFYNKVMTTVGFYSKLVAALKEHVKTPSLQISIVFLALFLGVLLFGTVFNHWMGALVKRVGLTSTNLALGVIFGFARGILVVAVLILIAKITPLIHDPWWHQSALIPRFAPIEQWLNRFLPDSLKTEK